VAVPIVPGGAGVVIKGARAGDKAITVGKALDKAGDMGKVGEKAGDVGKAVHGNSKVSTKAQHNYDIVNTETGEVVKTGVSGGKETKTGESYRGKSQANKWNRNENTDKYKSEIIYREPAGEGARDRALKYEKQRAKELEGQLEEDKHKRP
jgi:hypothetical protein